MGFGDLVYIGELAAASAAACWACSSIIYGRTRLGAGTINLAKNLIGTLLVLLHLIVLWSIWGEPILQFSSNAWFWLIVSGLIGIAIGDTCYFRSLQILGPRRSLVVATTSPIFGALLGWFVLGETINAQSMIGILITISGISVVVMDKQARRESPGFFPGAEWAGVALGLLAACCQATGGALSKIAMVECSPLEATFVRLLSAFLVGLVFFSATGSLRPTLNSLTRRDNLRLLLPAAALGTWMGIWFSQIGFKFTSVATATMLMSTGPLFAIPLVRMFDGHRISARAIWGTFVAILGIAIMLGFDPAAFFAAKEVRP